MNTKILWLLKNSLNSKLAIFTLSLLLTVTPIALAKYKPPQDQRPPGGYTSTTGSRGGCEDMGNTLLTVLAPQAHIGQTASSHPTFAWFVPNFSSLPMEFTLYTYDSSNVPKIAEKIKLQTSPGIMNLSLPKDKPGLTKGQKYLWQVAILCDLNHPSNDLVAKAEIKVVEMPKELTKKIPMVRDRLEMTKLFAEAGLWYDALAAAMMTGRRDLVDNLLAELSELEQPEAAKSGSQQSEKLKQILASRKQQQTAINSP